jgi:mannose PTS system EIID component
VRPRASATREQVQRRGTDALTCGLLVRIALRSLLLQAAWNFERMQHLGFCFALLPLIRRLHPKPGSPGRVEMLRRHLEFFNTHPVMAAVVLGAVARLEAEGKGTAAQTCKLTLMGSYGAIGDSFFWGALRPVAGIVGLASGLAWALAGMPGGGDGAALVAVAVTLVVFNGPQLGLRVFGTLAGGRLGIGVVEAIRRLHFPELTARVRQVGAAVLGLVAAPLAVPAAALIVAVRDGQSGAVAWPTALATGSALVLAAVLAAFWICGRGVVPTRLAWLLAVVAVGAALWRSA